MFLPNPGVLAAGNGATKTYAEFAAHIETLVTIPSPGWSGWASIGAFTATAASPGGDMSGSPWWDGVAGAGFTYDSVVCRVAQHSLPSLAEFNRQISMGRKVFMRVVDSGRSYAQGLDRNGYASGVAFAPEDDALRACSEFLYFGDEPMRMQPRNGLGPTPYDW